MFDTPYQKYLKSTCSDVSRVHKGYFSIDKKTGRSVDSQLKRGSEFSDDISAYDLILKNKERLLSFDEPTRFIFSHSALREGWDNPNVFQICTLKHSDSNTAKRQEVGRGLRLCVNQDGNRMDVQSCGDSVHEINTLTVDDQTALRMAAFYPEWNCLIGQTVDKAEYKFQHNGKLYKTIPANHTFQADWVPGVGTESIYVRIDEAHDGTKYDPIPYDGNMASVRAEATATLLCRPPVQPMATVSEAFPSRVYRGSRKPSISVSLSRKLRASRLSST